MKYPYDQAEPTSIETYGKRLIDSTLRKTKGVLEIPYDKYNLITSGRTRGSFGNILEKYYYGIEPKNSSSEPDFPKAGVELKATPIIKRNSDGLYKAKERLVLGMINYKKEIDLTFDTSTFLRKNAKIMMVSYEHEKDRKIIDHPVRIAKLICFDELSEIDQQIIKNDWEMIVQKLKNGKAHELSEGDTLYLAACTKSSDSTKRTRQRHGPDAKPRAFSFKSGFMTSLLNSFFLEENIIGPEDKEELKDKGFDNLIYERFAPYLGMNIETIVQKLNFIINKSSKSFYAQIANAIMGVKNSKHSAEFIKGNVKMKTIRLQENGNPKESMSFPAFKYMDIIETDWDDSNFKTIIEQRYFFVIFQYDKDGTLLLKNVMFWSMPYKDREEAKKVWERTVKLIKEGKVNDLPASSESDVCHVRPHARNSSDTYEVPGGGFAVKKSFWLNGSYLAKQIKEK